MASLSEVRVQVRDRLDEPSSAFWTDVQINRWVNEGVRDIARRCEVIQSLQEIPSVAATYQYTLPEDVVRVYRVEYQDSSDQVQPLEYRDFNSMDSVWWTRQKTTESSRPYWYTMWGYPPNLTLTVFPTPSISAETIRVFYYAVPPAVTEDNDELVIPTGWEDLIILYAEYVALRKDGDQRWQEAKTLYEERIAQMNDLTRRWTDQSDSIQFTGGFLPAWLYEG